jgi:hypothetical protein
MRVSFVGYLAAAACGIASVIQPCRAQSGPNYVALRPSTPAEIQAAPKFTFLLFYKENNANTRRITAELAAAIAARADRAQWQAVSISDPANRPTVEKYQLGRAPMPLVLSVAPNGAITGVMPGRVTEKAVDAALVTPTMTRCMKSLQAGKIVVVHVQSDAARTLPAGAVAFLADPAFEKRAAKESFVVSDPAEVRFLKDLEVDPAALSDSTVVVLAPPGMLVGKFSATASASEIAAKLHAAGKCCDDPNCKHNQKAQSP